MDDRAQSVAYQCVDDGTVDGTGLNLAALSAIAQSALQIPAPPVFADIDIELLTCLFGGSAKIDVDVDKLHHVCQAVADKRSYNINWTGACLRFVVDIVEVTCDKQRECLI